VRAAKIVGEPLQQLLRRRLPALGKHGQLQRTSFQHKKRPAGCGALVGGVSNGVAPYFNFANF
jgi:hypothetical protein